MAVDNRLDPIEDRVSIKALLNGGTDTFTETFNLPPCDDRVRSLNFHHQQPEDSEDSAIAVNLTNGGSTISPTTAGVVNDSPESMDYSSMFESLVDLNEQYLDFWTGPFGLIPSPNYSDLQLDVYGVSSSSLMLGGDEVRYGSVSTAAGTNGVRSGPTPSEEVMTTTPTTMATPTQNNHHRPSYPAAEQAEYVSSLSMAIYNKLWCLALDETARQELTACLNFLLTPERISKFISLYFRNWHLNCPMLHKPSFDPSQVPLALVVSVVFNGALYSKDNTERLAARKLFDIAELVVFDAAIFSFETEITRSLEGNSNNKMTNNDDVMPESGSASASIPAPAQASGSASGLTDSFQDPEWQTFQELQAGFLMVVTQYWAGSSIPKHRALESRLGDVIKVECFPSSPPFYLQGLSWTNHSPAGRTEIQVPPRPASTVGSHFGDCMVAKRIPDKVGTAGHFCLEWRPKCPLLLILVLSEQSLASLCSTVRDASTPTSPAA
jgi:hypothetical protein